MAVRGTAAQEGAHGGAGGRQRVAGYGGGSLQAHMHG